MTSWREEPLCGCGLRLAAGCLFMSNATASWWTDLLRCEHRSSRPQAQHCSSPLGGDLVLDL